MLALIVRAIGNTSEPGPRSEGVGGEAKGRMVRNVQLLRGGQIVTVNPSIGEISERCGVQGILGMDALRTCSLILGEKGDGIFVRLSARTGNKGAVSLSCTFPYNATTVSFFSWNCFGVALSISDAGVPRKEPSLDATVFVADSTTEANKASLAQNISCFADFGIAASRVGWSR